MTVTEYVRPTAAPETAAQVLSAEQRYADELAFLAAHDDGARPPGWALTPRAVVTFIQGSNGEALKLPADRRIGPDGTELPASMTIAPKFVGERSLVERCVVTLAGERGLLLVGEPGTAKSMLSELLAAAVCGTSALTVQGTAGTTEDAFRYGWNYALLLAQGPSPRALVDIAYVVFESGRLIRRLSELYGGRPGTLGFIRLARDVLAHLAVTGSIAAGDSIVQQLVGHGLAARLSAKLGEGGVNGMMTARIGVAAMETARPLPFIAAKRPGLGDFLAALTSFTAKKGGTR